jgi:alpha-beta hydrolase superfamily lysophospholipase
MLHGLISHSGWLAPVAEDLATRGIASVCPDRRGSGANPGPRGDAPSGTVLLDDLDCIVDRFGRDGSGVHLVGFCWGAAYALNYVARRRRPVRSLALLAPSVVPAPAVREHPLITGPSAEATVDPTIPAEAFTRGPAYEQVILPDPLRLRKVSPRLNGVLAEFAYMIGAKLTRLTVPTLIVLAEADRVVDNAATERLFATMRASRKELRTVPGEHGVQFDAPHEVAAILGDWLAGPSRSQSS